MLSSFFHIIIFPMEIKYKQMPNEKMERFKSLQYITKFNSKSNIYNDIKENL